MSRTSRDLVVSVVAGITLAIVFASAELVERLFELTREYEDYDLDQIIACIPALTIVLSWFAMRRGREVRRLNATLHEQARELKDALKQRQAMEEQLREGYKVAAMGTLGGGFAAELTSALEPISTLTSAGLGDARTGADEKSRLTQISDAATRARTIVNRMLSFGDGGMREPVAMVAAEAVRESISLARDAIDPTLSVDYQLEDDATTIYINRWELGEVGRQLVANAVEAMDTGGRMDVTVARTNLDADSARTQGLAMGAYARISIVDRGPGIPSELRNHVFEPFFTTMGAGDGKGLGLAIAYSLVRGWNGNLSVRSEPGEGATFEILIPTAVAEPT